MSEDYRVNRRSDAQVRAIATRVRQDYGADSHCPVDVVRCLKSGWAPTEFGKKVLIYRHLDDVEMGADDALTEFSNSAITVKIKKSIDHLATCGDGRSRMTQAHELAHVIMHPGSPKARGTGASGKLASLALIKPFESAEHQAKVFASAFLIIDWIAENFSTAEQISEQFGISLESAGIYVDQRAVEMERAESARRVERENSTLQASLSRRASKPYIMGILCSDCRNETLLPLGPKYYCDTCKRSSSQFPEGD